MDHAHNTPNHQSSHALIHQSFSLKFNHTDTLQDSPDKNCVIGKLVNKIENLKANIGGNKLSSQSKLLNGKQNLTKLKASPHPEFMNEKKTPNLKKSSAVAIQPPTLKNHQQLKTDDFPAKFTPNKVYCFIYTYQGPLGSPETGLIRRHKQVKEAFKKHPGLNYSNHSSADFLKKAKASQVKYRRSVIHLGRNSVCYDQGCGILVQYIMLFIPAYNHFVHYLKMNRYKKEIKQVRKVSQEADTKNYSKDCEQVSTISYFISEGLLLDRFQKGYKDLLTQISAHINDKGLPGTGFYKIKTLPYQSQNTNKLFQHLGNLMNMAEKMNP
ncbi:hypothetical protein VP01_230g9 [Puccinia sorghi]|uniref:Uncharacterized protein n=1 Tax=Puccinia sorghi TaxID=27349 RepID=A0A0L6V7P7_9BASI|nr:hypothetical protein VP01_230g9 [Puccinia sorghi]